jgi:hypothetical protein
MHGEEEMKHNSHSRPLDRIPTRRECLLVAALVGTLEAGLTVAQVMLPANQWLSWLIGVTDTLLVTLLVGVLMFQSRRLHLLTHYRFSVIAECNHHVRNALQAISYQEGALEVREHIDRIEWVLNEVLPQTAVTAIPEDNRSVYQPHERGGQSRGARKGRDT